MENMCAHKHLLFLMLQIRETLEQIFNQGSGTLLLYLGYLGNVSIFVENN